MKRHPLLHALLISSPAILSARKTRRETAVKYNEWGAMTQDYLGNNRAVVNGSTGEIEQTVAYYPYGTVIADLGMSVSSQPFKFGGKELTLQKGLNEYDFGARQYYTKRCG